MKYDSPKGTRDIIGNDFYAINDVATKVLSVLECFAYIQVRTPNFESIEILQKDCGEEMLDQIYTFEDKSGRKFGLKSDITPALTRIVSKIGTSIQKPIKLCTYDRVYRYERPQTGRYREITQINGEMFGAKLPVSDAECIATLIECLKVAGLTDFKILIGYRPLLVDFVRGLGIQEEKILSVIRIIDKKNKITEDEFKKELKLIDKSIDLNKIFEFLQLSGSPADVIKNAINIFKNQNDFKKYLSNLSLIINELEMLDVLKYCEINFGLARGSAYYTGIIFEAVSTKIRNFGSVGAGGRYDNLVKLYGGKDIPAVGFSIGIDRLTLLLKETQIISEIELFPKSDYYIVTDNENVCRKKAFQIAKSLRMKNNKVEIDLQNKLVSEQLMNAKVRSKKAILIKEGCDSAVIIDFESEKQEVVTIESLKKQFTNFSCVTTPATSDYI